MSTLSSTPVAVACAVEAAWGKLPQERIPIVHTLHGGVYTRTARIPKGVGITSATIKVPTTLVVHGALAVLTDASWILYEGTNILVAAGGRKQVMRAHEDTTITMIFPTRASTVAEAEAEFTDEWRNLQTADGAGDIIINTHQENVCQE